MLNTEKLFTELNSGNISRLICEVSVVFSRLEVHPVSK